MKIFGKFLIAFALFSLIIPGYLSNMDNANADYIDKFSLPYVLEPLTDSQIKDCESIHDDFTWLSDFDFYTRYQTNNFAGNCVMLYEDSLWDYEGSDRYEILSERSFELIQEREAELKQSRENFYIESKSLTELEIPGTFLFIFEGCTGSQTINVNEVYLVSDIETVPFTTFENQEREIPPGVCNIIERQIRADDPNSIKVVIPSLGVEVSTKLDEQIADVITIEVSVPSKSIILRGDLSHKATSLDEKNMKECENIYPDFQKFDENNFNTRYLYHEFVGDCVLLFEDPIWETRDSSNIDEINQRLDELKKQKEISRIGEEFKLFSITPMSTKEISDNLYIYSFEGCTGDEFVNIENAVAASDTEVLSLVNQKREGNLIPPGICRVLDIKIRADDPDTIKIVLPMMSDDNMSDKQDDKQMGQHQMMNNMLGNHHMPFKGMCAPGFAALSEICVLDDRCGAGAYPGRVCIMDGVMKQYLRPLHQKYAGISVDNIICAEGKEVMFKQHNASPACVNSDSIEKLKHRGWQTEKPVMACTLEWNPMCGMDGNTYGNPCNLRTEHMALKHQGECQVN